MFCPSCHAEYREGFTRCPECDVELVSSPPEGDRAADGASVDDPLELIWRGGDPVTYSRAVLALREAGIAHVTTQNFDHLAFGFAIPRPLHEIRACASDAERVRELLSELQDPFPLVPEWPVEEKREEPEVAAEPTSVVEAPDAAALRAHVERAHVDFEVRKSNLHWGAGLMLAYIFLCSWVLRFEFSDGSPRGVSGLQLVALVTLLAIAVACAVMATFFLYRSWAWRRDKIAFLALFFALPLLPWLAFFIFLLSR